MRIIFSPFYDTAMNLALEEYYFTSSGDEICFIYRNRPSVVVGKHQNIFKECNVAFCHKNNIGCYRRISGGGTVFHDLGNLNISLISTRSGEYKVDYKPLLNLITASVGRFGLNLREGERNDLFAANKKVTGTACHVVRNRTLHHGTLLYNSDKELLHNTLTQPYEFTGRGVESVRSQVTNIHEHLAEQLSPDTFFAQLIVYISEYLEAFVDFPTDNEVENSTQLMKNKYVTDEWNYNYSPDFSVIMEIDGLSCRLTIESGEIISMADLSGKVLDLPEERNFKKFIIKKG
jgi:lipoate---protein ligase